MMARSKLQLLMCAQDQLQGAISCIEEASDYIRISGAEVELLHDLLSITHDRLHLLNSLIMDQKMEEKSE